eukprot:CAMPEP_0196724230 /NCGR_PEP_ID=MMETSP1091-20130531/6173_1 /TAXON_ID=302021 /ORGANISM="Rhodomonas sp., Strain CCMP768" /LENGTH=512 /DNA_ID=CAMNT_0042066331 /DNA_START=65 /DNA_END=1603 /DNA_ORIENTATION=+
MAQPLIHFSASDEMVPSIGQDLDALFDALDTGFQSKQEEHKVNGERNSFSFEGPEDQFLPSTFQISSPRLIQLPSVGSLFSQVGSTRRRQAPKPISQPMRLLSDLDFHSVPRSAFKMSSVSFEHRAGKTIRTETTWDSDGNEATTVTEDDQGDGQNDFNLNDLMEAFAPRSAPSDSESADFGDMLQLFDLDQPQSQSMPCHMMEGSPQRLSATVNDENDSTDGSQPAATVQVMVVGDLTEEDAKNLEAEMGLAPGSIQIEQPAVPEETKEKEKAAAKDETPKRSEPVSEEEAEQAVKSSLADMGITTDDLSSAQSQKDLSAKIAAKLRLDGDDVTVGKQSDAEDEDKETDQSVDAEDEEDTEENEGKGEEVTEEDKEEHEDKDEASGADEDAGDDEADEGDEEAVGVTDADRDEDVSKNDDDDAEREVAKLQKEVEDEADEMREVKEKAANTLLALKHETDEKQYELLEAKDDVERAEEVVAKARTEEKTKEKDVDILSKMHAQLEQLGAVH